MYMHFPAAYLHTPSFFSVQIHFVTLYYAMRIIRTPAPVNTEVGLLQLYTKYYFVTFTYAHVIYLILYVNSSMGFYACVFLFLYKYFVCALCTINT